MKPLLLTIIEILAIVFVPYWIGLLFQPKDNPDARSEIWGLGLMVIISVALITAMIFGLYTFNGGC